MVLYGNGRRLETFAIFDEGSSITLIDEDVADLLALERPSADLSIQWFGGHATVERSNKVSLEIQGSSERNLHTIKDVRTIKGLKLPTQTIDLNSLTTEHSHLRKVPLADYTRAEPKILIGLDHHHLGVSSKTKAARDKMGIASAKTKLGWVV